MVAGDLGIAEGLIGRFARGGCAIERSDGPGELQLGEVVLALTDGRSASEHCAARRAPVILFDLAFDYANCRRIALAPADQVGKAELAAATGLFQAGGMRVSVLDDLPGMLVMRTVAMLVNEAAEAVHTGVASAADIDIAMRLGVNYPAGPLAWAEAIGLERVFKVVEHLARSYGEDRYRPAWLLRRKVISSGRFHD
jgi:3-hydroxybutyryl-CoA dehydrogenase